MSSKEIRIDTYDEDGDETTIWEQIDIELDDFDTDELIDVLSNRLSRIKTNPILKEIEMLKKKAMQILNIDIDEVIKIETLEDRQKYNYIQSIFHKYSLVEIENKLPN